MDEGGQLELNILEWSVQEVHALLSSLGLPQYLAQLQEHDIDGEILVHLDHAALKDIGIHSVGQRLAVLKAVYKLKLRHDVPFEEGHWMPPADDVDDASSESTTSSLAQQKMSALLNQRDDRIKSLELEVKRLAETLNVFRDEVHIISKALYTKEPPPDALRRPHNSSSTTSNNRSPIANTFASATHPHSLPPSSLTRSHSLQHNSSSNYFSSSRNVPGGGGGGLSPSASPLVSPGAELVYPAASTSSSAAAGGSSQISSETLADHAVLRSHGSSNSLSNAFDSGANPPLTPGALLGHSPATPIGQSPSSHRAAHHHHGHNAGSSSLGTAREVEALKSSASSIPHHESAIATSSAPGATSSSAAPVAGGGGQQALSSSANGLASSTSGGGGGSSSSRSGGDHPYRSFRVTLEDPCYKVLPAALKKYKINDDWRSYALFICYGNGTTERCLCLDEKPLLLFQKLKDGGQNPVFMLRHIKDVKSPIHVASQKHASKREKRAKEQEATLTSSSALGPSSSTSRTMKMLGEGGSVAGGDDAATLGAGTSAGEDGPHASTSAGGDKADTPTSAGPHSQTLPSPTSAPIKGHCIAIYPYMAEREDEFDVGVGDTFVIVNKAKGWWVVYRQSALAAGSEGARSGWVPAGCLLETTLTPTVLASDPTASSTNASKVPIKPASIVSVSTPGIALMDFTPTGSDELRLVKSDLVRVYKRYNHWSYAIKESTGERGWSPSWFLGRLGKKSDSASRHQTDPTSLASPSETSTVQ